MGPTPTRMRLSCNFVNGYTIAYRVQYTRASLTDIHARKSARVGQVGGQVGADRRACPARGKLNGEVAGHADFRARILARKSARMSVSVSVPWNLSLTTLSLQHRDVCVGRWRLGIASEFISFSLLRSDK